jgi:type IV fimbrial biogenesis protein FimT
MAVVLAVTGTLTVLSLPATERMHGGSQVRSAASAFMNDVNLARSEAIKLGRKAVLCPSMDGTRCLSEGEWHRGWILFDDRDGDREHAPGETLVRQIGAQSGVTLVTSRSRRRLVMHPTGFSPGSNGTYTVCPKRSDGTPLAVIVANNGRARVARERPDGGALRCDRV